MKLCVSPGKDICRHMLWNWWCITEAKRFVQSKVCHMKWWHTLHDIRSERDLSVSCSWGKFPLNPQVSYLTGVYWTFLPCMCSLVWGGWVVVSLVGCFIRRFAVPCLHWVMLHHIWRFQFPQLISAPNCCAAVIFCYKVVSSCASASLISEYHCLQLL